MSLAKCPLEILPRVKMSFEYLNGKWMKQIPIWNVCDISERTNNFSEGM
jgi:hypothetical protein